MGGGERKEEGEIQGGEWKKRETYRLDAEGFRDNKGQRQTEGWKTGDWTKKGVRSIGKGGS